MITHTVSFQLKEELTRADHGAFFEAAKGLGEIPGVIKLGLLRQTSAKNPYAFCFTMEFRDESAHESYSNHPRHIQFVEEQWMTKVASFQEADFEEVEDWPVV
jgi:heme-degrading monooxygenase HmoA